MLHDDIKMENQENVQIYKAAQSRYYCYSGVIARSIQQEYSANKMNMAEEKHKWSPCNALKAVAAQAGFAKSTKQRIRGSPPRCILNNSV